MRRESLYSDVAGICYVQSDLTSLSKLSADPYRDDLGTVRTVRWIVGDREWRRGIFEVTGCCQA